jgi:hypothetical protein
LRTFIPKAKDTWVKTHVDLGERERVYVLLLPGEPAKVAAMQRAALADFLGAGESQETEVSIRHDEFLYPRPQ